MHRIALLTKKILKAQRNSSATNFKVRNSTSAKFQNKKLKRNTTLQLQRLMKLRFVLLIALCPPLDITVGYI